MSFLTSIRKPFRYTYTYSTAVIIAVNIFVFLLTNSNPNLSYFLGLNPVLFFQNHMYWQPFTYMFVHGSFSHIFFNMLGLVFFGFTTERAMGSKEFVLMYLVCGFFSGIISLIFYTVTGMVNVFLIGASGAIYSMLLAFAVIFPRSRIFIWGIIPVPAPLLIIIYAVIELGSQLFSLRGGIAHLTHLAGFAVAWLYFIIRMGIHPIKVWKDAYRK